MKMNYFHYLSLSIFCLINLTSIISNAQTGLTKSKEELIFYIRRPAYTLAYPEVNIEEESISTFSKDLKRANYYALNSYGRCTGEIMSEVLDVDNYDTILSYFKTYLKALNFDLTNEINNNYINSRERVSAQIVTGKRWLSIVFKKY